jgi:hypothetical protein
MKKSILIALVALCLSNIAFSQIQKTESNFVVIVEPFSLFNGGFDIGSGYALNKNKVELKYRQTDKSDPIARQKNDFDTKYKTLELSYNYFLNQHLKGFFVGGTANYFFDYKATEKVSGLSESKDFSSIGLRLGYYWYPFKKTNLFIDPTLAINFNLNDIDIMAGGKTLNKQYFRFPPAGILLRIGYQF